MSLGIVYETLAARRTPSSATALYVAVTVRVLIS